MNQKRQLVQDVGCFTLMLVKFSAIVVLEGFVRLSPFEGLVLLVTALSFFGFVAVCIAYFSNPK